MNILSIYINEIKLGEMTFDGSNYVFKANEKNVEKANKKGYTPFLYGCEQSWTSQELPLALQDFIPSEEQLDLLMLAEISPEDTDFEKLCKMAAAKIAKPNFHIEIE